MQYFYEDQVDENTLPGHKSALIVVVVLHPASRCPNTSC